MNYGSELFSINHWGNGIIGYIGYCQGFGYSCFIDGVGWEKFNTLEEAKAYVIKELRF